MKINEKTKKKNQKIASMRKVHKERLLELADHLNKGRLGHKRFDFGVIHLKDGGDKNHCGSAGCAIGEMPVVWPDKFKFDRDDWGVEVVVSRRRKHGSLYHRENFEAAQDFFGLSIVEASALFSPRNGCTRSMNSFLAGTGMRLLTGMATRKQVAANIKRFVEWKEKQS